jgi:prepilin-type N-terminal cleavage/methylation domain-containing protein
MLIFKNEKGITLIEMLVTISIMGIVGLFLTNIFQVNSQVFSGEQKVMSMNSNARQAIHEVAKNLRLAGYDPLLVGANIFGITAANGTSITYTIDQNVDGTAQAGETLGYAQVSGTPDCPTTCISGLILNSPGATRIIARDITASPAPDNNPAFCLRYTFANGAQSSPTCADTVNLPNNAGGSLDFDQVRAITITVTTRTENPHNLTKRFHYETISSTVMLRNNLI